MAKDAKYQPARQKPQKQRLPKSGPKTRFPDRGDGSYYLDHGPGGLAGLLDSLFGRKKKS